MKYKEAGVDIEKGNLFIKAIKPLVSSTFTSSVIGDLGGFAGLFLLSIKDYKAPLLVATADGVGTKLKIAFMADKHDTVGIDLVAMCVNDLICVGAQPLFFLDYFACGRLQLERGREVIKGIVDACREVGCVLLGGETAEMPGFYASDEYELCGFAVGIVEKEDLIDGSKIQEGDIVIGLASSGLHSNGFSLVRKILFEKLKMDLNDELPWGVKVKDELLKPTKLYVKALETVKKMGIKPKGIAHITGGGLIENPPRVLPSYLSIEFYEGSWDVPFIFSYLEEKGEVEKIEMYRTFNMGIGMIFIFSSSEADLAERELNSANYECWQIGKVIKGNKEVKIRKTS